MQLVPGNKTSERDGLTEGGREEDRREAALSRQRFTVSTPRRDHSPLSLSLYLRIDDDKEVQCTLDALLQKQMTSSVVEGKMWGIKATSHN